MQPQPAPNSSFSTILPTLQLAVDSTSLGEFKVCPRKYYYRLVEGWVPRSTSIHLIFGLLLHRGREDYERLRAGGAEHEDALRTTVRATLLATWHNGKPWWSDHRTKNRLTLVRTLVWYLDQFGREDPLQTILLSNGRAAVELSFKFSSGFTAPTSEPITLCGHLDRLAELNGQTYVCDIKTTSRSLGASFFAQFNPDNQFSLYTLAGRVAFQTPVAGVIVDACQILPTESKFERQPLLRAEAQVNEWLRDTGYWLGLMSRCAETGVWPQNDKSCNHYHSADGVNFGGCPYRPVCSRPPAARQKWLETDYVREAWDPAIARGELL